MKARDEQGVEPEASLAYVAMILRGLAAVVSKPARVQACCLGAMLMLTPLGGCAWKGERGESSVAALQGTWDIRPARMRVYPTTRFVREASQGLLEARIELLDELDDPVKGVGEFHIELLSLNARGETGDRLYLWTVPMHTQAQNKEYWDAVSRTYLFRLKIDDAGMATDRMGLRVRFNPAVRGPVLLTQQVVGGQAATERARPPTK